MESDADQEALYRFLGNSRVTSDALLAGHHQQTLGRMRGHALVRIVHDTSQFCFEGEREGMGTLQGDDGHRSIGKGSGRRRCSRCQACRRSIP